MKVFLVDDESLARERMKRLLEKHPDVSVIGEAADGVTALNLIYDLQPDLVFLDIEMPELDGLSVADQINKEKTAVVFVTAFNEHAVKAFDLAAVDYVVKPVADARLAAALEKTRRHKAHLSSQSIIALSKALAQHSGSFQTSSLRRLAVRCGAKFVVLDPARISAIKARDHYSAVIYEGRELLADDPLDVLTERLNSQQFLRVHRSAVINIDFLKELERQGDRKYLAHLSDSAKTFVPISRERLNDVKARLGLN